MMSNFFKRKKGGGMAITMMGLTISVVLLVVFVSMADYALYSYKRNIICRGIDYSILAAIQEVDVDASSSGLSTEFDESSGVLSTDNIILNETSADNAFFSTFKSNTGIDKATILDNTLITIVNPYNTGASTGINYIIKKGASNVTGSLVDPSGLETVINSQINSYWNPLNPDNDKHIIYVSGNPATNKFERKPYYIVFLKNYEIDGLFKKRTATFVGFRGANLSRKK